MRINFPEKAFFAIIATGLLFNNIAQAQESVNTPHQDPVEPHISAADGRDFENKKSGSSALKISMPARRAGKSDFHNSREKIKSPLLSWFRGLSSEDRLMLMEKHSGLKNTFKRIKASKSKGRPAALAQSIADWIKNLNRKERRKTYGEYPGLEKAVNMESEVAEKTSIERTAEKDRKFALLGLWFNGLTENEKTEFLRRHDVLNAVIGHRLKFADKKDRQKIAPMVFSQWYTSLDREKLRELHSACPSLKIILEKSSDRASNDNPPNASTLSPQAPVEEVPD
ncbi:MAG: hypothetical protein ABIG11_00330 [bacterium]